jgi:HD-like signal output (HDOD) protein
MSDTTQQIIRSPAEKTVTTIREALSRGDTACVTQVLEVIQQMSNKVDELSVHDLADIIGRDLTTVAKIMKAANCLGYNPGAAEVTTLPQAIGVIGFETIRNLVVSLLLIESAEKRFGEEKSHEVAAVALSTAMTAQAIAQRTPGLNPEQAFVCGALRHYGKLLLSTFLPDEYLDAMELAHQMPVDAAFRKSVGLTPLELGQRILAESSLPKVIQHALEPARPDLIRSKKLTDTEKLLVVADFSEKFCELIDQSDLTNVTYEAGVAQLLKSYAPSLGLDDDELKEVVAKVSHSMTTVGQAQGFKSFASVIVNRMERIAAGRPIEKRPLNSPATGTDGASVNSAAPDLLAMGIAEIERLVSTPPVDTRKVYTVATRAVRAGLHARSCLVFLREHDTPLFSPVVGVGPLFHELRNQSLIDPVHKDVFSVCIARGEDVLIKNPDEPSIAPFIPAWFRGSVSKGPLLLLPVKDTDGTFAVICAVVGMADRIELSGPRLQQLKKLRACLAILRDAGFDRRAAA